MNGNIIQMNLLSLGAEKSLLEDEKSLLRARKSSLFVTKWQSQVPNPYFEHNSEEFIPQKCRTTI